MTATFRAFVDFIDQDEITDEQITEVFGVFATHSRAEQIKRKRDEVRARSAEKDAKWKAAKDAVEKPLHRMTAAEKEKYKDKMWNAAVEKSKVAPKTGGPSTASRERAGEVDWQLSLK